MGDSVCVVAGAKPLIVRQDRELESEFVCQLPVGTELRLLQIEAHHAADGPGEQTQVAASGTGYG